MLLVQSILLILVGFVLLIKGADFLVEGSRNIAKKFHIPEVIIGLTVVSIGTSMPELFVSITSALEGHSDMAIGNVVGSNICNFLLILGLSAIVNPVKFQKETRIIEIPLCLVFTLIFCILANTGAMITRGEAGILLTLFDGFIIYTIVMAKKGDEFDKEDGEEVVEVEDKNVKPVSNLKNILFVIGGIFALKFGGDFTVDNALVVAEMFNLSEKIISLTILAVGTSLPELVTSVIAAKKGDSDIAIGNIIGSNIFNMLLIIGTSALIKPIVYSVAYNLEMAILIAAVLILSAFALIPPKDTISKKNGAVYLSCYIAYIGMMFII